MTSTQKYPTVIHFVSEMCASFLALHMPVICYQTAASPVLIPLKHPANKHATTVTYSAQSAAWWPAFVVRAATLVIVGARACDWQLRTRGCASAETCPKDNIHNVTQQWKWTKQKYNVCKQYPTSYVLKNAICKQYIYFISKYNLPMILSV